MLVSRDVIFEEGHPHRTSPDVGENLPLFDTLLEEKTPSDSDPKVTSPNTNETTSQQDNILPAAVRHADPIVDHHADIPTNPVPQSEPRRSSRIPQPSAGSLQSKEYQN